MTGVQTCALPISRVKVNVEDYLNQDLRSQMDTLLEKPEEMMNEIKEF